MIWCAYIHNTMCMRTLCQFSIIIMRLIEDLMSVKPTCMIQISLNKGMSLLITSGNSKQSLWWNICLLDGMYKSTWIESFKSLQSPIEEITINIPPLSPLFQDICCNHRYQMATKLHWDKPMISKGFSDTLQTFRTTLSWNDRHSGLNPTLL